MADLFRGRVLVLDVETSGFHQDWSRVVDLAAVVVEPDGSLGERFESLVCPDIFDAEQAAGAIAVHHITPEMVRGQPSTAEVAAMFRSWVAIQRGWSTSFNIGFDRPHLERMGVETRWCSCVMLRAFEQMAAAGACQPNKWGKPKWPSLSEAGQYYGAPEQGTAHRALPDALRAAGIMVEIARRAHLARAA
jgi:DNA polymerase III epsilon subunit-like protein